MGLRRKPNVAVVDWQPDIRFDAVQADYVGVGWFAQSGSLVIAGFTCYFTGSYSGTISVYEDGVIPTPGDASPSHAALGVFMLKSAAGLAYAGTVYYYPTIPTSRWQLDRDNSSAALSASVTADAELSMTWTYQIVPDDNVYTAQV